MDEYGWGLTSAGFRRPTYNELLDALEHKARELFGATANLTVRSPVPAHFCMDTQYPVLCAGRCLQQPLCGHSGWHLAAEPR